MFGMNAWIGLLKKEFRATRGLVFSGLGLLVVYFIAAHFLELKLGYVGVMLGLSIIPVAGHVVYMLIYMFTSLNTESSKLHLWLHNPQPAVNLLAAKIVNGLFGLIISMALSILFLLYSFNQFFSLPEISQHLTIDFGVAIRTLIIAVLVIIVASLFVSMWVIAAWTIYQTCKTYIGKWSILIAIGFMIVLSALFGSFENTQIYHSLTSWGYISFTDIFQLHEFDIPPEWGRGSQVTGYPLGAFVYNLIKAGALFLLSCYLLDRKVEV